MKKNKGSTIYIIPRKVLIRLYYTPEEYPGGEEGLSLAQVGKLYHLCGEAVRCQMKKYNLPRIDRTKRKRNQYTMIRPRIISDGTVGENNK